jgi:hypothetical protein
VERNLLDLRIGDLIHVPDVETVIDLSEVRDLDPEDPENRVTLENLGHSFVITDDIRDILTIVFGYLDRKEGRGFFVIGNYGTGKSHLLSVLGLTARYSWAQKALQNKFRALQPKTAKSNRKYLPVLVPLTEYASDVMLEDILMQSSEKTAAAAGIPLSLSSTQHTIETFNRYILREHETEFLTHIKNRFGDITWEQIYRDDPASAHTIINQFSDHSGLKIPVIAQTDRRKLLTELIETVTAAGWDGVFFIIDELSEFLKSKPSVQMLHEDTRFLQFLGESIKSLPIWVIAAIQESLDMNQDISTGVFRKIKERYQHMTLSTGHLQQFISQRLLPRNNDQSAHFIGQIYDDLHNAFNSIPIKKDDFVRLYPVHPETLEILNLNIDLFSRHRGLVDFLSARIRGRPESLINGILDQPCHTLLTPDAIFDHFQNQLSESDRHFMVHHLFKNHFQPSITYHFDNQDDRDTALKTVKILILLSITPLKQQRSVKELANMILYRVFETDFSADDANYAWFEEHIIRVLFQHVGHLKRSPGKSRLDDVYQLSLDIDPVFHVEDRIDRVKSSLNVHDRTTYSILLQSMSTGTLPLAACLEKIAIRDSVVWQNTRRRIAVKVIHASELSNDNSLGELKKSLKTGRIDFAVMPVFPDANRNTELAVQKYLALESDEIASGIGFVFPEIPDSDSFETAMLEIQACRLLINDTTNNAEHEDVSAVIERLKERLENSISRACTELQNAYVTGTILLATGPVKLSDSPFNNHFDKWLGTILQTPLNNRFPQHHNVAPNIDCQSKVIQDLLLEKFIRPGNSAHLTSGKDDIVLDAIEKIALPLGLANKKTGVFYLDGNPSKSKAADAIMNQLPLRPHKDSNTIYVSAGKALMTTVKPPLGMTRPVFELALLTLVRKGYVKAVKSGQTLPLKALHFPLTGKIDRLQRGDLISDKHRPAFFRLYKLAFNRNLNDIDLDIQDALWKKLQNLLQSWKTVIEQFKHLVAVWSRQHPAACCNLKETDRALKNIESLKQIIERDNLDTIHHWHLLLQEFETVEKPDELFTAMKQIKLFVEQGFAEFSSAESYLSKLESVIPDDSSYSNLNVSYNTLRKNSCLTDDLVLEKGLAGFLKQFHDFRQKYTQIYRTEHKCQVDRLTDFDADKITLSLEYRVLHRLTNISFFQNLPGISDVKQSIYRINHQTCHQDPESTLDVFPVCSCGFKLGTVFRITSPETWKNLLQKRVVRAFSILRTQAFLTQSSAFSDELNVSAEQMAELQKLLSLNPVHQGFLSSIEEMLDTRMIGLINKLAEIRHPDLVVSCNDLFCEFSGCTLTMNDVREKLQTFLERFSDYDDDKWIKFDN